MRHWSWGDHPDELREALHRGRILVIPTESSYGFAVDPRSAPGVEAIYRLKERERGHALPVVAADLEQIAQLGVNLDALGAREWTKFWPAPLNLVLPCVEPHPAGAGTGSLAVRVPAHARLQSLLASLGTSLTATSANRTGCSPVLDPAELDSWLAGQPIVIVDDGVLPGGAPSTVVRPGRDGKWCVLREGRFPVEKVSV